MEKRQSSNQTQKRQNIKQDNLAKKYPKPNETSFEYGNTHIHAQGAHTGKQPSLLFMNPAIRAAPWKCKQNCSNRTVCRSAFQLNKAMTLLCSWPSQSATPLQAATVLPRVIIILWVCGSRMKLLLLWRAVLHQYLDVWPRLISFHTFVFEACVAACYC